jgi:hypothetical protein
VGLGKFQAKVEVSRRTDSARLILAFSPRVRQDQVPQLDPAYFFLRPATAVRTITTDANPFCRVKSVASSLSYLFYNSVLQHDGVSRQIVSNLAHPAHKRPDFPSFDIFPSSFFIFSLVIRASSLVIAGSFC